MQFDLAEYLDDFIKEIKNLLIKFEQDLELLKSKTYTNETINEIFRLAHSIKGMSATMEFEHMEKLTHREEDMLDKIRSKEIPVDDDVISVLYEGYELISLLLESIEITATEDGVSEDSVKEVLDKINKIMKIEETEELKTDDNYKTIATYDIFTKILNNLEKTTNNIYFVKITINENSPLLSARAFMILTSLKEKEDLIASNPALNPSSDKLFELHINYFEFIFSSQNNLNEMKEYLENFPEVEDVKIKNINLDKISFNFEENLNSKENKSNNNLENDDILELMEITSLEEVEDIINYIETDIINKELDKTKETICNLEATFLSMAKFFKENEAFDMVNLFEKIDFLIIFCKSQDEDLEDRILDTFIKFLDLLKKVSRDSKLLMNDVFVENIREFSDDIENKILEESANKEIKIGEILSQKHHISKAEIEELLLKQKTKYKGKKLGEVAVAENKVEAQDLIKALNIQKHTKEKKKETNEEMIRIPSSKADKLLDLLEELMMIQSQVEQNAVKILDKETSLVKDIYKSFRITKDIQNLSISFRMITLHSIFQKVSMNAHDAMKKLNKKVKLEISGEGTEIDRIVGSKIVDPLLHLIKNSIAHGIEDEKERVKKGKDKVGKVFLSAYSEKGYVYISIADDGSGVNTERVYNKALEKGLIDRNKNYTDDEIVNFIFLPGFSTTENINQISGRGVGMDVVKTEIQKLRGRIVMQNHLGKGLTIQLRIPQNMTSLNGTVIKIKGKKYIIPSIFIKEVFRAEEEKFISIGGNKDFVKLRDQVIPLINTDNFFDGHGRSEVVLVLDVDNKHKALPIDEVMERREIVVKPLSNDFDNIRYIIGASILGDGKAALILGVENLFKLAEKN